MLLTPDDFARLVFEVVEDSVLDGAVWVEPSFYAPHHRNRFGADERSSTWCSTPLHAAGEQLGVGVGLMLAADRTVEPSVAVEQARLAATRADRGVVSFGLANDEAIGPPEPYAEAFADRQGRRPALHAPRGRAGRARVGVGRAATRCSPTACSTACARSRTPSW